MQANETDKRPENVRAVGGLNMNDLELLSEFMKAYGVECTPEELEERGFKYWLTELTDEEARRLGAVAYLKRRGNK